MKKLLVGLIIGLLIGWASLPFLQAEDTDFRSYKQALHVMISIMKDVQRTSQITADNTTALRKKLNAE